MSYWIYIKQPYVFCSFVVGIVLLTFVTALSEDWKSVELLFSRKYPQQPDFET